MTFYKSDVLTRLRSLLSRAGMTDGRFAVCVCDWLCWKSQIDDGFGHRDDRFDSFFGSLALEVAALFIDTDEIGWFDPQNHLEILAYCVKKAAFDYIGTPSDKDLERLYDLSNLIGYELGRHDEYGDDFGTLSSICDALESFLVDHEDADRS